MQTFIGITDYEWYRLLSSLPQLDELNFWQPMRKSLGEKRRELSHREGKCGFANPIGTFFVRQVAG